MQAVHMPRSLCFRANVASTAGLTVGTTQKSTMQGSGLQAGP